MLLLPWYYHVPATHTPLSMINRNLFHSLLVVDQDISKKILKYLSRLVTSTFKPGTGGCGSGSDRGG